MLPKVVELLDISAISLEKKLELLKLYEGDLTGNI